MSKLLGHVANPVQIYGGNMDKRYMLIVSIKLVFKAERLINIDKTINSNIGLKNYKIFFKLGVQNYERLLNIDKTIKL